MIEINLLGSAKKQKISTKSTGSLFGLSLLVILLVEIVFITLYTFHLNNRVETLTQQRNRLKSVEKEVKIIKSKLKQVKTMTAAIKNLEKGRGRAYKNLKNIADVMPNGLWLVNISKKGKILRIQGKSFSTEAIAQYMTNLGNLKNVAKVNFDRSGLVRISNKGGVDIYKFYIMVALKD